MGTSGSLPRREARRWAHEASRRGVHQPSRFRFTPRAAEALEPRCLLAQYTLGALTLSGTFGVNGTTVSSTGPVEIGFTPTGSEAFTPLTEWTPGVGETLSFTTGATSFDFSGVISGYEQGGSQSIATVGTSTTPQTFDVNTLTGGGIGVAGGTGIAVLQSSLVPGALTPTLTPNNLALVNPAGGDTVDSYVSLQGGLALPVLAGFSVPVNGSNSVQMSPSTTAPGLTLAAGVSTAPFTSYGATFSPSSLSVAYSSSANAFQISGAAGMATTSGDFTVSGSLGTPSSPGLIVGADGSLTQLVLTLSTNITTNGLSLAANGLTISYDSAQANTYSLLSGTVSASTTSGDVTFSGQFGASGQPGLVLSNGALSSLYVTVNGSATAHGLTLTAADDVLQYQAASGGNPSQFEIVSGSITVGSAATSVQFTGTFGASGPGLVLTGGSLSALDVSVSTAMTVDGMSLTVNNLEFEYINDASSIYNGDFLIQQGQVSFSTAAGDTTFAATFGYGSGSSALPGLVMSGDSLLNLYATVTSSISAQGLTLSVNALEFQYVAATSSFEILSGLVSVSQGSVQFASATFGNSSVTPFVPGLVIQGGKLTGLDVTINSNLSVDGMSLSVSSVELVYAAVSGQTYGDFTIAQGGSVSLSAGSSNTLTFSGLFGAAATGTTPATPGLSLSNGVLQSFYIAVNSNIDLGGSLTLTTTGLAFSYVSSTNTFELPSGSVSVVDANNDFSFTGTFGTSAGPGLVVTNGALTALNIVVTAKFSAGGLNFTANNLNFLFAAPNSYEIATGSIAFSTSEGYSFEADFGLPSPSNPSQTLTGLVIQNGVLSQFNAALTSSFTVAGLEIDVTDMAMSYQGSGQYAMYGTVDVNTAGVQFTGTIGQPSASPPVYGLVIQNNVLKSLAITIDSSVTFGSLSLTATGLSFNYTSSPQEEFTLYGTVSTSIAGVTLTGVLGSSAQPGLTIVNGALTGLNLSVSTDFTLFGLTCDVNNLTFQYSTSSGTPQYVMYGSLSVSVSGNSLTATMGNSASPGLVIVGSTVTQINMAITGTFQASGFGFSIQNAGLDYTTGSGSTQYLIFGTFSLTDVFSATVQLGTGSSNPGITITNGVFQLDNFAFSLDNVAMGAFELNYVNISYASAGNVWSGAAQVTFPNGWAVGAGMTFVNGNLSAINLSYAATGSSQGIAIGDTGVFVIGMTASLQNLNEPVNIIVSGSITAVFGGKISIGGTTCAIFAAVGSFTADSQELVVSGSYYEGAYQSNGKWTGILGSGTATVTLDWAAGDYSADVSMSLYGGVFTINAEMAFNNSGDLGLIATASVNVPSAVPFIGGTKLGSMSFAFLYDASSNSGSVSAWTTVFGITTTGFEYSFNANSTGSFSLIGAGGVSSIENQFNAITSTSSNTPPVYVYTYIVTVPSTVTGEYGLSVQASWPSNSGTQTLYVNGPSDPTNTYYSNASPPPSSSGDSYVFLTQYTTSTQQSMMIYGSGTSTTTPLKPGTYTFEIQSSVQFPSTSSIVWSNQLYYTAPSVAITSVPSSALTFTPTMTGFAASALATNTTITLYADTDSSGYTGSKVGSFSYAVNSSGVLQGVPTIDLSAYTPGVPIYIYAVINDGTNTAVNSAYSKPIVPLPNLVGRIVDQFGNPIAGMTVFLDLNNTGQYVAPVYSTSGSGALVTAGDPVAVTNLSGYYYFNDLESYSSTDIGYPTFRVCAMMPNPSYTPVTPATGVVSVSNTLAANSSSLTANFTVNRLASISGSLYRDLNRNGVQNANDPALGGASVFLDVNGSGVYQAGDPICVTGPSGTFGFFQLTPTNYITGVVTAAYNGPTVSLIDPGFETPPMGSGAAAYQFGPISLSPWTFSGNAGLTGNGSSIGNGTPNAPQGMQAAFLQGAGASISQAAVFSAGTYQLAVKAAQLAGGVESIQVLIDGTLVATITPTGTSYAAYLTTSFTVTAGTHTLEFLGATTQASTSTAFIDSVAFNSGTLQQNYVVTSPSSGTYPVTITSDAQQLTLNPIGVISLATISGTISSQATNGATSTLSGVTVVCATPTAGVSEPAYSSFSSTTGLVLNGASQTSSNTLSLIGSSASNKANSAWYGVSVPATTGFAASFNATMSGSTATSAGFAFVIQNNASGTAAKGSSVYGYGGLTNSLAVIFDATDNQLLLVSGGSTTAAIASITSGELGFSLASGKVETVYVTYLPTDSVGDGQFNVYLGADAANGGTPVLSANINLGALLGLKSGSNPLVGFTAGTTSTGLSVSLSSWSYSALTTQSTVTNSAGGYSFTGLMPGTNYTVTQIAPAGQVQASPLKTEGVYSQSTLAALIGSVSGVATGDFNGDGIPDVAYSYSLTNGSAAAYYIAYALGLGNGGFSAPVSVSLASMLPPNAPTLQLPSTTTPAYNAQVAAGYFDSTAHEQIAYLATDAKGGTVVVTYDVVSNTVVNAVIVQTKSAPAATSATPLSLSTINNVAVGDLNNDGYSDLAVSTFGGVWTMVSLENLTPVKTSATWVNTPAYVATPYVLPSMNGAAGVVFDAGVTLADFNGDGNLDVGTVNVTYLEGKSYNNASQTYVYSWSNPVTVQVNFQPLYGNGSGVSYAATGSYLSSTGVTTTTTGAAQVLQSFTANDSNFCTTSTPSAPTFPLPCGLASVDVTGDGVPDLEFNGYNGSLQAAVVLFAQSSPGVFSVVNQYVFPNGKSFNVNSTPGANNAVIAGSLLNPSQITPIDMNGDGFVDVLAVEPNSGQMMLLTSQAQPLGAGASQAALTFASGSLGSFAVADFSLNGYPDVVVPAPTSSLVYTPTEVLNGTINIGTYSYTPTDGQALTGQNFLDVQFAVPSTVSASRNTASASRPGARTVLEGRVYRDDARNGVYRVGDPGLGGVLVYVGPHRTGAFDPTTDFAVYTNAQGYYSFSSLTPGRTYYIHAWAPAGMLPAEPMAVSLVAHARTTIVERNIGLRPRVFANPVVAIDPLIPQTINLAYNAARGASSMRYTFVGQPPAGMTLNTRTGVLTWIAPAWLEGKTIAVAIRAYDPTNPSASAAATETLLITVRKATWQQSYVRGVFESLLSRAPNDAELKAWTNLLATCNADASLTLRTRFVAAVMHSPERANDVAYSLYNQILGRGPTPAELSGAVAFLTQGGNSDALAVQLLGSGEFSARHPGNADFAAAINHQLIPTGVSRPFVAWELGLLARGVSRGGLVQQVMQSAPAVRATVVNLANLYLGSTPPPPILNGLVSAALRARLSTDQIAVKLLASVSFVKVAATKPLAKDVNPQTGQSPLYQQLSQTVSTLTGQTPSQAELDAIDQSLLDGHSLRRVVSWIAASPQARTFAVQTQYRNLLGRSATQAELNALLSLPPSAEFVQVVRVQILSSREYRALFATTTAYASAVWQVLTGRKPSAAWLNHAVRALNAGEPMRAFVRTIAHSPAAQAVVANAAPGVAAKDVHVLATEIVARRQRLTGQA